MSIEISNAISFAEAIASHIEYFYSVWENTKPNKYFNICTPNTTVNKFIDKLQEITGVKPNITFAEIRNHLEKNNIFILFYDELPENIRGISVAGEKYKSVIVILVNKNIPENEVILSLFTLLINIMLGINPVICNYTDNPTVKFYNNVILKPVIRKIDKKSVCFDENNTLFKYGRTLLAIFDNAINDELILFRDAIRLLDIDRTSFDMAVETVRKNIPAP